MKQRLQKLLASHDFGSRRQIEALIADGLITVNGKTAQLGDKVDGSEPIRVKGRLLKLSQKEKITRALLYHKPEGEVCTRSDPQGRPTIFRNLPKLSGERWMNVGRLDINSSGLLIITNDGELANKLAHPSSELEREYAVRCYGELKPETEKQLLRGVKLDGKLAKFIEIKEAGGSGRNHWYHVVLTEGRYREVRRLFEQVGIQVNRLIRIRYGNIQLPPKLRAGQSVEIDPTILSALITTGESSKT